MSQTIGGKLNVMKINKERLFPGKNGAKWLDFVLIPTPGNEYGDFMIVESVPKQERAAGKKGAILGNAKFIGGGSPPVPADKPGGGIEEESDVPF